MQDNFDGINFCFSSFFSKVLRLVLFGFRKSKNYNSGFKNINIIQIISIFFYYHWNILYYLINNCLQFFVDFFKNI